MECMERACFCLTLDTELYWGVFDKISYEEFKKICPDTRKVFSLLLDLFEKRQIKVTWAFVGHLFLKEYYGENGKKHPHLIRPPTKTGEDRLSVLPFGSVESEPYWYGADLVELIRSRAPEHEIALHTFTHTIWTKGISEEVVRSELEHSLRYARELGLELKSFVFPRNQEGFHHLLREYGFTAYRGSEDWLDSRLILGKPYRIAKHWLKLPPRVSQPEEKLAGLWNIRASMFLPPIESVYKALSLRARVIRAKKGIERAVEKKAVFHLWFHPHNACQQTEAFLFVLDNILRLVEKEIQAGRIENLTMAELAEKMSKEKKAL